MWAENLFKGIDIGEEITNGSNDLATTTSEDYRVSVCTTYGSKAKDDITIQVDGGKDFVALCCRTLYYTNLKHIIIIVCLYSHSTLLGFQNTYIFAERHPITSAIWETRPKVERK